MVAFFDTNILVYLADNRDARKQSIALDSVMLAAAEQMGATIFYTEDLNDGQVYAGVRAVNPFAKSVRPA